jgi:hypothetical protein
MSVNKVVSTQFIAQIKKGKRVLNVAYVDKTELWRRPIISDEMKKQFIAIAEENIESCNKSTETVAFQYVLKKSIPAAREVNRLRVGGTNAATERPPTRVLGTLPLTTLWWR